MYSFVNGLDVQTGFVVEYDESALNHYKEFYENKKTSWYRESENACYAQIMLQGEKAMFFNEPKTLILVCNDEMVVNQLKKLVETNDDENEEKLTGTKDGSVRIVSWNEKMWMQQKEAGNINSKILFLGDIKGTDKLIPVIDEKFNDCGVRYGWAGNQAVLYINTQALKSKEDYNAFLEKLQALPLPEQLKKKPESPKAAEQQDKDAPKTNIFAISLNAVFGFFDDATGFAKDVLSDRNLLKQQMIFYGIINLYNNHLEQFIQG